ncbi:hypothetical protein QBC36DRAFT_348570 [Triangularia setosa]|uniref:Uncharacterized protein n=1 Tax=Triangularia setosa TaxID=2587417 RepID=A0AAN6W1E3_9PEZI|nr:hypothetical protein QBC36DRAFT_348570 [Podospora setosa]
MAILKSVGPRQHSGALILIQSLSTSAPSSPAQTHDEVDEFTIVPIPWDFPIKAGDPNGATEATYPGWNARFQSRLPRDVKIATGSLATLEDLTYDCKINTDMANILAIKWGILYLCGVPGKGKNGPGPKNCGRSMAKKEVGWGQIAELAQGVLENCARWEKVKGQGSHKDDKWRVIVRFLGKSGSC